MTSSTARASKKRTHRAPRRQPKDSAKATPDSPDLSHIEAGLLALAVPIGEVSEDPANVREHREQNLEALKASIRRFGQQRPVLVDQDCVVVAGNGTLRAMRDWLNPQSSFLVNRRAERTGLLLHAASAARAVPT